MLLQEGGSVWRVEACSPTALPQGRGATVERNLRAWWEIESVHVQLAEIVSSVAGDSSSITFSVDDTGELIR